MKKLEFLIALSMLLAGCAKEIVPVGKGDPTGEFKACLDLSAKGKYEDAIQCMEMFKARYPKTPEGIEALIKIGDAQFSKKEYLLAAESYQAFIRLYPTHSRVDYAYYRTGVSYFKESPKAIDRDQEYLTNAIDNLKVVVLQYPRSDYFVPSEATLNVALKRIARRHFYVGKFYYKTGEYIACISRFREVAEVFPNSGLADLSLYYVVEANLKLKRIEDAKNAYSELAMRYPRSKYLDKTERHLLKAARKSVNREP